MATASTDFRHAFETKVPSAIALIASPRSAQESPESRIGLKVSELGLKCTSSQLKDQPIRHFIPIAALLLATLPALADSIAIGGRRVTTGDGTGKVVSVAGKPDRIVQLETEYGGAVGERREYYRDGKRLMIEFHADKVASITETR